MIPKDMTGREIKVGDRIAYPGRYRSNLWQNIAQVYEIEEREKRDWYGAMPKRVPVLKVKTLRSSDGYTEAGKKTFVQVLSRVIVIEGGAQ